MMNIRKSKDRGHAKYGWLNTYYTFSFNTYYDENHMGFKSLRVINEDVVSGESGFEPHPHKDMEIITYIVDGELTHQDSTGKISKIKRGDVQVMSAGSGIVHSEMNTSKKPVHLLQIWIVTDKKNHTPRHDERTFTKNNNALCLIVSKDGTDDSLSIHQDVKVFASIFDKGHTMNYALKHDRSVWIQLISGELSVGKIILKAGDGLSIEKEDSINIKANKNSEFILFDLV